MARSRPLIWWFQLGLDVRRLAEAEVKSVVSTLFRMKISVGRVGAGVLVAGFVTTLVALAPATAAADSVRITSDPDSVRITSDSVRITSDSVRITSV